MSFSGESHLGWRVGVGLAVVLALGVVLWTSMRSDEVPAEFVRLTNLGVGHIENRTSADAIETLTRALSLQPTSVPALRNLARAHLIPKGSVNAEQAVALLVRALELEPQSASTHYLLGLALNRAERYAEAVSHLEQAVRLDPKTAALRYQLGRSYERNDQYDKAYEQFTETIRLDLLHDAAYYRLAAHARQRRDRDEVIRLTGEFERLKKIFGLRPEDIHERCVYTAPETVTGAIPVRSDRGIEVRWTDATDEVFAADVNRSASTAAVIEVASNGGPIVFAIAPNGAMSLWRMSDGGDFERTEVRPADAALPLFTRCAVGEFHLDITTENKNKTKLAARNDVALVSPDGLRLFERTGHAAFEDRTAAVGLDGIAGYAAAWIDYDHNGVLDLFVATDRGLQLWENRTYAINFGTSGADPERSARFENVTEKVGLALDQPLLDVAAIESDQNAAIDVVAVGGEGSPVFVNQRAGYFAPRVSPPGLWDGADRVLVDDVDNDGTADALLVSPDHALLIYNGRAKRDRFDFDDMAAAGAVLVDYDNDGWLDVCAFGSRSDKGRVRFWRGGADGLWTETSDATGASELAIAAVTAAIPGDYDVDGDTDLLFVTDDHQLRYLRNDGGDDNGQLKLRLVSILTNPTGLGQHIELRDGSALVSRFVTRLPIDIGVGRSRQLDTLHVEWTNGVVDNDFNVAVDESPHEFIEKMVEIGSCPFLFAWDGTGYRFVTDTLGNSPIGLSLRRDVPLQPDPTEYVLVGDADIFPPHDGFYNLIVSEAYREVLYLDAVRLVAVDHAPDVEIHPTDKLMPPPFPESELWAVTNVRSPMHVASDDGIDRSNDLRAIDGVFAPPGTELPRPFRGMCRPLTLTLAFAELDTDKPLVLVLTGWLRYGSASVNIALEQNADVTVIPPTLEVETEPNVWSEVDVVVGIPAGKTKTIVCDLTGKLPSTARRLRLRTTFEISWDRIALGERVVLRPDQVHTLPLRGADLDFLGFPEMKSRGDHHPITPDFDRLSPRPQWRTTPAGWCTRYGDVLELLDSADGKFAVINAGEAVTLRFDADGLLPPAAGQTRTFFHYSVGWEKDSDYNVIDGDTVEPLPDVDGADGTWRFRYNTRFVPADRFHEN